MATSSRTRADYLLSPECKTRALRYLSADNPALHTFLINTAASNTFGVPGALHYVNKTRTFVSFSPFPSFAPSGLFHNAEGLLYKTVGKKDYSAILVRAWEAYERVSPGQARLWLNEAFREEYTEPYGIAPLMIQERLCPYMHPECEEMQRARERKKKEQRRRRKAEVLAELKRRESVIPTCLNAHPKVLDMAERADTREYMMCLGAGIDDEEEDAIEPYGFFERYGEDDNNPHSVDEQMVLEDDEELEEDTAVEEDSVESHIPIDPRILAGENGKTSSSVRTPLPSGRPRTPLHSGRSSQGEGSDLGWRIVEREGDYDVLDNARCFG